MRRVLPLVVLGLSVAAVAASGQRRQDTNQSPQAPTFRSGVDVVSLNVTVTDAAGRFATDLTSDSFVVYEDGDHQTAFTPSLSSGRLWMEPARLSPGHDYHGRQEWQGDVEVRR